MDSPEWQNLAIDDLVHINQYARRLILSEKLGRFLPVQGRWVDPIGPGISDGRHRTLPANLKNDDFMTSQSGCSGMGISAKHEYGLVYKNVGRECGIYRSYNQSEAPDFYVGHLLVDKHAHKLTTEEPIFNLKTTEGYSYLRTQDWTNNADLNVFRVGVVTYQRNYPEDDGQARIYSAQIPKWLLSVLHPPGEIYLQKPYNWQEPDEWRFAYGNISSSSKILACQRIGAPITIISSQLKRFNNKMSSFKSNSEGSFRLLCQDCHPFQTQSPKPSPYLPYQGCGQCIGKANFIDCTLMEPFGAIGLAAYRLTFAMPIKTIYKYRMPQLANFMHVNPPHLWHEHLQIDHTLRLSRMKLSALRIKGRRKLKNLDSPQLFQRLIIDTSSEESGAFLRMFKAEFLQLFPNYDVTKYFKECEVGWAQPKSLGVSPPLVTNCVGPLDSETTSLRLHSNWTISTGVEFRVGELTLKEYLYLLRRLSTLCLQLQPRVDAITEKEHCSEVGSYVYNNMALLEILDYCNHFDRLTAPSQK